MRSKDCVRLSRSFRNRLQHLMVRLVSFLPALNVWRRETALSAVPLSFLRPLIRKESEFFPSTASRSGDVCGKLVVSANMHSESRAKR